MEAAREGERECTVSAQIILRRVVCYDLITTTHQFISLKSGSNIQEGSSKVVPLCPVIVVFTNFLILRSSLPNNYYWTYFEFYHG